MVHREPAHKRKSKGVPSWRLHLPCKSTTDCAAHTQVLRCPLHVGPLRPELEHCPPECGPAPCMRKYRVYTDGKTLAGCIVENCEAKVCSFKDACHDPRGKGIQGAFCVEHHNQLVDLKVCRLPVGHTQETLHLGSAMDSCLPPCHQQGCLHRVLAAAKCW